MAIVVENEGILMFQAVDLPPVLFPFVLDRVSGYVSDSPGEFAQDMHPSIIPDRKAVILGADGSDKWLVGAPRTCLARLLSG